MKGASNLLRSILLGCAIAVLIRELAAFSTNLHLPNLASEQEQPDLEPTTPEPVETNSDATVSTHVGGKQLPVIISSPALLALPLQALPTPQVPPPFPTFQHDPTQAGLPSATQPHSKERARKTKGPNDSPPLVVARPSPVPNEQQEFLRLSKAGVQATPASSVLVHRSGAVNVASPSTSSSPFSFQLRPPDTPVTASPHADAVYLSTRPATRLHVNNNNNGSTLTSLLEGNNRVPIFFAPPSHFTDATAAAASSLAPAGTRQRPEQTSSEQPSEQPHECVAGRVTFYSEQPNSREASSVRQLKVHTAPKCAFPVEPSRDVVCGVWHCLKCEAQLATVEATWARQVSTVYLASSKGAKDSYFGGAPSSSFSASSSPPERRFAGVLVDTGVDADDYLSTLGKGLLGLKKMFELHPNKKWYAVVGDDVFVDPPNLADLLSAFDPNLPWCFSQASPHAKHGFRAFGGAGVITSHALTKKLLPLLGPWLKLASKGSPNDRLHDVAFVRLLASAGGAAKSLKLSNLDGLYSQCPGFYLSKDGKEDVPRGLPLLSGTFHYVKGAYMVHLHRLTAKICVHCRRSFSSASRAFSDLAAATSLQRRRRLLRQTTTSTSTWGNASTTRAGASGVTRNRHHHQGQRLRLQRRRLLGSRGDGGGGVGLNSYYRPSAGSSPIAAAAAEATEAEAAPSPAPSMSTWRKWRRRRRRLAGDGDAATEEEASILSPEALAVMRRRVHVTSVLTESNKASSSPQPSTGRSMDKVGSGGSGGGAGAAEASIRDTWGQWLSWTMVNTMGQTNMRTILPLLLSSIHKSLQGNRDLDWFLVVRSSTYVIPSNLAALLSAHDATLPVLITCPAAAAAATTPNAGGARGGRGKGGGGSGGANKDGLLLDGPLGPLVDGGVALTCGFALSRPFALAAAKAAAAAAASSAAAAGGGGNPGVSLFSVLQSSLSAATAGAGADAGAGAGSTSEEQHHGALVFDGALLPDLPNFEALKKTHAAGGAGGGGAGAVREAMLNAFNPRAMAGAPAGAAGPGSNQQHDRGGGGGGSGLAVVAAATVPCAMLVPPSERKRMSHDGSGGDTHASLRVAHHLLRGVRARQLSKSTHVLSSSTEGGGRGNNNYDGAAILSQCPRPKDRHTPPQPSSCDL